MMSRMNAILWIRFKELNTRHATALQPIAFTSELSKPVSGDSHNDIMASSKFA
jgi:hypothetical protein